MSHYETTVRLTHISTSSKARSGLSVADAVGAAKAHLRYITRDDAAQPGDVIARSNGGHPDGSPDDLKAAAREAIDKRSQRHTDAYGVRLADRLIVSLPRDDDGRAAHHVRGHPRRLHRGQRSLRDGRHPHGQARNPTRISCSWMVSNPSPPPRPAAPTRSVRRADALRLNEGGNRQEVRERIAATINAVAAPAGRRLAEVRSFKNAA